MIRRACENDIKALDDLLFQVLAVHAALREDIFIPNTKKYSDEELTDLLKDDSRPVFVYVDEEENRALAHAFCIIKEIKGANNLRDMKTMYIDDICVDRDHRGSHIAKELYEYVRAYAASIGCYNITLNVWKDNVPAERFYDSMGLKPMKTTMEDIL